ncbi:MAG TPA: hypothetical protein VN693_05715 [Rhodanobacteraceae bacterium]|nr:hypothetical protein [Rhodanobacteraceae bacterium]
MSEPPSSDKNYVAQPPKPVFSAKAFFKDLGNALRLFWATLKDTFAHFDSVPEEFDDPPAKDVVEPEVVEQCLKLYERSEATRKGHEDKARGLFAIVSFLTPLVGAGLVYILGHWAVHGWAYRASVALLLTSEMALVLAFLWIARVVGVRARQTPGIGSVIDKDVLLPYDSGRYAQNLVYCASYNEGMNALYAQFVRNAHSLTVAAMLLGMAATVPLGIVLSNASKAEAIKADIASQSDKGALTLIIGDGSSPSPGSTESISINGLERRVATLEARLSVLEYVQAASSKTNNRRAKKAKKRLQKCESGMKTLACY